MKIYANTNNLDFDQFVGTGYWVEFKYKYPHSHRSYNFYVQFVAKTYIPTEYVVKVIENSDFTQFSKRELNNILCDIQGDYAKRFDTSIIDNGSVYSLTGVYMTDDDLKTEIYSILDSGNYEDN